MKKFVFNILVFIVPIAACSFILDAYISRTLRNSNTSDCQEYSTWNSILDGELNAEVYIYGTSRARGNVISELLESKIGKPVYNLGIDGHNIHTQLLRHHQALKFNKKPKYIVHVVDAETIEMGQLFVLDQFLPYMLWNDDFKNSLDIFGGFDCYDYYLPLVRYYGKFYTMKTALHSTFYPEFNIRGRVKGYQANTPLEWIEPLDTIKLSRSYAQIVVDSLALQSFEKYLQDCKSQHIDVIITIPPYYHQAINYMKGYDTIINLYKSIAVRYDMRFLDFSCDSICYDKRNYSNATHLNHFGANIFTNKLANEILKLKLQQ